MAEIDQDEKFFQDSKAGKFAADGSGTSSIGSSTELPQASKNKPRPRGAPAPAEQEATAGGREELVVASTQHQPESSNGRAPGTQQQPQQQVLKDVDEEVEE